VSPSAAALLRWQFRLAHELLDAAMARLSAEAVHRCPPGAVATPGACYGQVLLGEDLGVNGVLAGRCPLALSTWAGRTGLSELPPFAAPTDWHAWARHVRLDLTSVRPYAQAVYAATDAYLASLPDDELELEHDAAPARVLSGLLLTVSMRRGEIAALVALFGSAGGGELSAVSPARPR
jgi:hypothetical protein